MMELLEQAYAQRALLAAVLTGLLCGVLGCFILLRNMSLIGDALSHAVLPGVVGGFLIAGHSIVAFFTGSVLAGLFSAVLITWLQRNVRTREDAAIGIVFSAMFAAGVMGISVVTRQEGVHLDMKDFLFGNILGIAPLDLILMGSVTGFTLLCILLLYRFFFVTTFQPVMATTLGISSSVIHYFLMLLLSFAVVASLQAVGVILAVAMLIIPASTAYLVSKRLSTMLVLSALFGVVSSVSGFFISVALETTPGPAMTLTATALYLLMVVFAPERGILPKFYGKWLARKSQNAEDVLKAMVKEDDGYSGRSDVLAQHLGISTIELKSRMRWLLSQGLLLKENGQFSLSHEGQQRGFQLIRAHRLWESYLAEKEGLTPEQIHEQAEDLEHHLPERMLKDIESELGFPKFDPHGSPIPQRAHVGMQKLGDLQPADRALFLSEQPSDAISAELWHYGLMPLHAIVLLSINEQQTEIEQQGRKMVLPALLLQAWVVKLSPESDAAGA